MDRGQLLIMSYINDLELKLKQHSPESFEDIWKKKHFVIGLIDWLFHAKHMNINAYDGYRNFARVVYSTYPQWFDGLEDMYEDDTETNDDADEDDHTLYGIYEDEEKIDEED